MRLSMLTKAALLGSTMMALSLAAVPAVAQMAPAKPMATPSGPVLTDDKGMTLYTFDMDSGDKSACTGGCPKNWPPLGAAADAKPSGDWSVITRDDGSKQWAYHGKPLYAFVKDTKPGDMTGDGMLGGKWHTAKP